MIRMPLNTFSAKANCIAWFALLSQFAAVCCGADLTRYIAPIAQGDGSGASRENAAAYTDTSFWTNVQNSLSSNPVTVRLLDGQYSTSTLELDFMGDPYHQLTLTGDTKTGAIFSAP